LSRLTAALAEIPGIRPLAVRPDTTDHTYHIYVFRLDEERFGISRERFLLALDREGVPCIGGYAHPLYRNPMFLNQAFYPRGCPMTCCYFSSRG
jgi:dTDP-4-amino-4,6-dideoxygalactose transaminase